MDRGQEHVDERALRAADAVRAERQRDALLEQRAQRLELREHLRLEAFGEHGGERPFCERERRIVDIFHHECAFLHQPRSTVDPALLRGLPPRLCETLRGLARGRSEKQLAADLGLSQHTVHEYVKALHRHFGVQSRSELLALCLANG